MPMIVTDWVENTKENVTCSLCLEEIQLNQKCIELPCKDYSHIFCADNKNCPGILTWFKKSNSCPVCRTEFPHKLNEESNGEEESNREEENENIITTNGPLLIQFINRRVDIPGIIRREEQRQLEFALQASILEN